MIYRIRWVRLDEDGHVCWEDHRRVEYKSARRNLLGQIITRTIRGGETRHPGPLDGRRKGEKP